MFRCGFFVVSLWWNLRQRWFVDARFLSSENYAVFLGLFFNRLRAFEDYGVEAVAGVDARKSPEGAFAEG